LGWRGQTAEVEGDRCAIRRCSVEGELRCDVIVIVIVVGADLGWGRTKVLGSRALALR
jgi:hypothetical protein